MANDTDYKKMWRKAQSEIIELHNLLFQANQRLETQGALIKKMNEDYLELKALKEGKKDE